jgi:hypothetical protein
MGQRENHYRRGLSIPLAGGDLAEPLIAFRPAARARLILALLVLVGVVWGILLRDNPGSAPRSVAAGAADHHFGQEGLLSLPAAARGAVSAGLGKDARAYSVTAGAGAYHAASPGQRLALRFTRTEVSVASHHGSLGLALREIGHGNRLQSVSSAPPRAAGNRVSYALGGGVREWFTNGPLGLEQGFDVARAPGGASGPLTLDVALSGNLRARLAQGGVTLTGHGAALRYAGLAVRDARGRRLRAWLELRHRDILIRVADRGARYPLHVDPWVQSAELTAGDAAANASFGYSVAVSANTVVVGAPHANNGAGAVYVFTRRTTGWANATQTAELTPSDPQLNQAFGPQELGFSVAIDGSTIGAGAPYWSDYSGGSIVEYQGAVYVWTLPKSGVWASATQTAMLSATDLTNNYYLGTSVAVQGSTIVAGAPEHLSETPINGEGEVYVYTMPASGGWQNANQNAELSGYDEEPGDGLGYSVAISGTTIVAGAPEEEWGGVGALASRGGVYVWTEPVDGVWGNAVATAELLPSDLNANDQLGKSVAISGSTIVAGAPFHTPPASSISNPGAVYVWTLPPTGGWNNATQPAELTGTNPNARFVGNSVAVSGNTVFGGGGPSIANVPGVVYEWTRPASGFWADETQTATLAPSDSAGDDLFGDAMAMSATTLVIGAFGANGFAGKAYVYGGGYTISGRVYSSSACSCSQTPIADGKILVSGKTSDGTALSQTALTDADGDWSVMVPNGSYTAGPSLDGSTFAELPSFDPETRAITVSGADVPNQDFVTCIQQPADSSVGTDVRRGGDPSASVASAPPSQQCVSQYKITLKASIPQSVIVDPSKAAHYRVDPTDTNPGFNDTDYWFSHYLRATRITRELSSLPTFPDCEAFPNSRVEQLTRENATIRWFSQIVGKTQLGSATVTLAWNQSLKKMQFVSGPTIVTGKMTRTWRWDLEEPGKKPELGSCSLTEPVSVKFAPVLSSAAGAGGQLKPSDFTLIATWDFPFDPEGLRVDTADTTIAQRIYNLSNEFSEWIESHPKAKFVYETGSMIVEAFAVGKLLHALKAFALASDIAYFAGEAPAIALRSMGKAIDVAHEVHQAKDVFEAIGIIGGALGFGEESGPGYPLMSAVVRGHFETTPTDYGKVEGAHDVYGTGLLPTRTTLAVSAATTDFPNIGLTIARTAKQNPNSSVETYSGLLPWRTTVGLRNAGSLYVNNDGTKGFGGEPSYLINNSADESYAYGYDALDRLLNEFEHMLPVQTTLREDHTLVTTERFPKENDLAPAPSCTTTAKVPQPLSLRTICWQFTDGEA